MAINLHLVAALLEGKSLTELATLIVQETARLEQHLKDKNLSQPGFEVDSPSNFPRLPEEIQRSREIVTSASKALADLTTGPQESMRWLPWHVRMDSDDLIDLQAEGW
jgi:hypothetical protein